MKALTLYQPWAFLVMLAGHIDPDVAKLGKHFETRSWPTKYRGPLAIHASKNWPRKIEAIRYTEPFFSVLERAGYKFTGQFSIGAVIAICNLVEVYKCGIYSLEAESTELPMPSEPEISFGDFSYGRFAWKLEDVKMLPVPIPAKGHQGLWNWEPPESFGEIA